MVKKNREACAIVREIMASGVLEGIFEGVLKTCSL